MKNNIKYNKVKHFKEYNSVHCVHQAENRFPYVKYSDQSFITYIKYYSLNRTIFSNIIFCWQTAVPLQDSAWTTLHHYFSECSRGETLYYLFPVFVFNLLYCQLQYEKFLPLLLLYIDIVIYCITLLLLRI